MIKYKPDITKNQGRWRHGMENEVQKKGLSIKTKLLGIILPVVIVIVALLTMVSYMISKNIITDNSEDLLSSSIENQANEIEAWLNENLAAFQAVKQNIEGTKPSDAQLQNILNQYFGYNANYPDGIYVADAQGNLITAEGSSKTDANPAESVWYREGLTRINMGFTSAYSNEDGTAVVSASGILNDGSGRQRVISADMTLQRISIIVNSLIEMKNAQAFLVSTSNNTILAHRDTSLISTQLSASSGDSFLSGVAQKIEQRDYSDAQIDGNLTVFEKIDGTDWILVSYIPTSIVYASVNQVRNVMLIIGIVSVILLAVIIERVVNMVIKPVKELTGAITRMTDGDFTISVNASGSDEIGMMSRGVEKFVLSMRNMIASIHNVSDRLRNQADESYNVSKQMNEASSLQNLSMEELNQTVTQLSASIGEIADHATQLAAVVSETRDDSAKVNAKMNETVEISRQGRYDMNQVGNAMSSINSSIEHLKEAIDKVGAASGEITNITTVIADIAEETNLLSLNASIEAARAGESGRGFAVVATQIGKLAQTSSDSVKTIEGLIRQINEYVGNCVELSDGSVESINNSSTLISTALGTFDKIYDNIGIANELVQSMIQKVEQVDDVATNVAAISQEQAASSEEISATSDTMVEHARSITNNSEAVAEESKKLTQSSNELTEQINIFKI